MPVESLSEEELSLQEEDPNMAAIMKGFDLDISRIEVRSGFEGESLEGSEKGYFEIDIDEAFGLASIDKPMQEDKR